VYIASPVKVSDTEIVAVSSPQKHKLLRAELVQERRKGRDDPRVESACRGFLCRNRSFLLGLLRLDLFRIGFPWLNFRRKLLLSLLSQTLCRISGLSDLTNF
jgi:hypothetical protein